MKRSLSSLHGLALTVAGICLIAGTYGLVRLAYGLLLPDIQESVAMSPAVAGYVSSGASAAYCAGALAGLVASGRPRLLVTAAFATAATGAVGMALSPGTALLVPSAVLASAGAGFASPGLVAVVARNIAEPEAGRAQAVVNSGTGPGLVAAGLLALLVPDWRVGFALSAAVTALAGLVVLLLDRGGRHHADRPAGPARTAGGPGEARTWPWLVGLRRPLAGALLLGTASAAVWTYGRTHLVSTGTSDTGSVLAWIAIGVGGSATVLTARSLSALAAPTAWMLTTGVTAVAVAALASPQRLTWTVVACGVFGWGFVAATSALIAWTGALAPDRAAAGTAVAFVALVLGQAAGSSAAGVLSGGVGMPATFGLAALAVLVGAVASRAPLPPRKSSP